MSELLERQLQLKRQIDRSIENFKKIGKTKLTAVTIRNRISLLKSVWRQFADGNVSLVRSTPEESRDELDYFHDDYFDETEETFQSTLDAMENALAAVDPAPAPLSQDEKGPIRTSTSTFSLSHLPPIPLPHFDGNAAEWEQFRDRFETLIINNPDLNNFARIHFLSSCVTGSAREAIKSITIVGEHFDIAWQTLKKRYENKRRLLAQHLSTLLALPPLTRESETELQTLCDRVNITIASLESLNRSPSELWSDLLVHLVVHKLDPATRKSWNIRISESDELPGFGELTQFISNRTHALAECSRGPPGKDPVKTGSIRKVHVATSAASRPAGCDLCGAQHYFSACPAFVRGTPIHRRELVKRHKQCFNCLSHRHAVNDCKSKHSCRTCHKRHHSMLHVSSESGATVMRPASPTTGSSATSEVVSDVKSLHASFRSSHPAQILLSTAWVTVTSASGRTAVVRALLDSGSQMTFVTGRLAQLLRAQRSRLPIAISALGGATAVPAGTTLYSMRVSVSPRDSSSPAHATSAVILPKLTDYAPTGRAEFLNFPHLAKLQLADPTPTSSDPVDLLIGADLYNAVLLDGRRTGAAGEPSAQRSIFGWVLSGPLFTRSSRIAPDSGSSIAGLPVATVAVNHGSVSSSLDEVLRQFWEVEELPHRTFLTAEEENCEQHFLTTHSRAENGRYIVRLPFRHGPPLGIGESRARAARQLESLLGRLRAQPERAAEYSSFLHEYEQLGHMRRAPTTVPVNQTLFIPHHPVIRESSLTTRLRVVFNASSPTSNGKSLNDCLLPGPKLQSDLPSIITQWRQHRYVYVADIAKMYRQILIDSRDIDYQRILWTPAGSIAPKEYQLLTVTYGTACAPFLAQRVIKQLVVDEGAQFPLAVPILREQMYVDDVLFGGDEVDQLREARVQLVALLRRGGFELRKWASNSPRLLQDIEAADHGVACSKVLAADDQLKILGISWSPSLDFFKISVSLDSVRPTTKRSILSMIARLYDPLGWLTPTIVAAKVFMQLLWREGLSWDAVIPADLLSRWSILYASFSALGGLRLACWMGLGSEVRRAELHGFADASNVAYAAVVYLRVITRSGAILVSLVAGKSRVAPVRPVSVPRLELCGAVLLARLLSFVRRALGCDDLECFCWTDSTVALAWLTQHPSRWKTFVANRVAEVQTTLPDARWRHVPTHSNPADCASRGLLGHELAMSSLWWRGPDWLGLSAAHWPDLRPPLDTSSAPDARTMTVHTHLVSSAGQWDLERKFSSWPRLLRVTAYVLRFVRCCRPKRSLSTSASPAGLALTAEECQAARTFWLKRIQATLFASDINDLQAHTRLTGKSAIVALSPFLDNDGLLRVGGRLRHAPLSFSRRHPILLASHPLVALIIAQAHSRSLHAGLQLTLTSLRNDFWILRARSLVRSVIHRCLACARERAEIPTQIMGDLPAVRTTASARSFLHSGVDYAGPVHVRPSTRRPIGSHKAYIALFICLATRAIHLELVSDCSTPAFIAAFTRFCSRRGLPKSVYSDNGTTFVGADREIARAYQAAVRDPNFLNKTAVDTISWHFLPPASPHFGGLWEAGVQSVKHHVRRVLGNHRLTFEGYTTLLCGIEACLGRVGRVHCLSTTTT